MINPGNDSRLRVLLVIPNVPFPIVSGGHMRDAQIVYALNANGIRPHILYFGAGENYELDTNVSWRDRTAEIAFGGMRREHPDRSLLAKVLRKLGYVTRRIPTSHPFAYQYDAIGACDRILECARRLEVEVIILRSFWCHYAERLRSAGFKVIANCPDYNVLLAWEMVRSVRNPLGKVGSLCNYLGVRKLETHFLPQVDEVWAPTEREADAIGAVVARKRILRVPNLIDVAAYPDLSNERDTGATLLFVANYSYLPNANAAQLLLGTVFPAIRRQRPDARLLLVGQGLSAELKQKAHAVPGVEFLGFVEDLTAVYRRAAVVLLPVREGAGMLFKTLEALAIGRPSIGFRQAFRGIARNADAYVAVDSPERMVEVTIELLSSPTRCRRLATSARRLAQRDLSWSRAVEILGESRVLKGSVAQCSVQVEK